MQSKHAGCDRHAPAMGMDLLQLGLAIRSVFPEHRPPSDLFHETLKVELKERVELRMTTTTKGKEAKISALTSFDRLA